MLWSKKEHLRPQGPDPDVVFAKLRDFLAMRSALVEVGAITRDTRLFSSGLLDSLAYAELVFFVEESLGVVLSEHVDVTMDRLDRLGDAVNLIAGAGARNGRR